MTAVNLPDIPANLQEFKYVSRYGTDQVGLQLMVAGTLTDADGPVTVSFFDDQGATVFERTATHQSTGTYVTNFASSETSQPGYYSLVWQYTINSINDENVSYIEVGQSAPAYDALPTEGKAIVDSVWNRFADLFDSPYGGPNLQVYFQSKFGRGRVAEALGWALNRINAQTQPTTTWNSTTYPYNQWGQTLEWGTYVETIKHLRRSYIEQPRADAVGVARMDRKDYADQWASLQRDEEAVFTDMLATLKIAFMGLGSSKILVSGGVFGRYGPTQFVGDQAARPLWWTRIY